MRNIFYAILCFAFIGSLKTTTHTTNKITPDDYIAISTPVIKIDLDLDPKIRYSTIVKNDPKLCKLLSTFMQSYYQELEKKIYHAQSADIRSVSQLKESALAWYDSLKTDSKNGVFTDFKGEIQNWVDSCNQFSDESLTIEDMVIYNWVYEFGSLACTSIIWFEGNGSGNSKVRLASNLDYDGVDTFSYLTRKAEFYSNGVVVYEANMILGFYGFTRVYKKLKDGKIMQMSLNQRRSTTSTLSDFLGQISDKSNMPVLNFFRDYFQKSDSYHELSDLMLTSPQNLNFGASFYIIMNDEDQGQVAEIEPNRINNIYTLDNFKTDEWYLVQTNSDRNNTHVKDDRRTVPEMYFKQMSSGSVSSYQVFEDILSRSPNFMIDVSYGKLTRTISSCYVDDKGDFVVVTWVDKQINMFKLN